MSQRLPQTRPDQSMSLLTTVAAGALEPEYREISQHRRSSRGLRLLAIIIVAALLVFAGVSTTRTADARATERQELASLVAAEQQRLQELEAEIAELTLDIRELSEAQIADPELMQRLQMLGTSAGAVAVTGPGIVVIVNDSPGRMDRDGLVLDTDLSRLVNGLWQAGAEAVAVNGRRITITTPIRAAGAAITVDYVSLSPPYRVEAIGDPDQLQARFGRTSAASWWYYISRSYGIEFDVSAASADLELAAAPRLQLIHATKGE